MASPNIVQGLSDFGATIALGINPGASEILMTTIQAPSSGAIEINYINIASLQFSGAFKNPTYAAFYVMRGGKGQTPPYGDSTSLVGLPSGTALQGSLKLLVSGYINVQSQATPFTFERGILRARNGEALYVCCSGLVDGTTSPPTLIAGAVSLTVLGSDDQSIINAKLR